MRRLPALALLLAPVALAAQAPPSPPPAMRIPGMSPAGVAALDKLKNRQDPAVPKQLKDEAAIRQQMAAMLAMPNVDVDKLAATMAQARAVQANGRRIMDEHLLIMLRALPAGDRPALLRAVANPQGAAPAPAK